MDGVRAGIIHHHVPHHVRPCPAPRLAGLPRCRRAAVVDALRDLAADADLHRVGDRHGGQAARADQQLRQPVRAVLGRGVRPCRALHRLQRLVVPADPGLPGDVDQPVHRAQHAQDLRRAAQLQGADPRAVAQSLPPQGRGHARRLARDHAGAGERPAGGPGLARARPGALQRHHGGGAARHGQQGRLSLRAFGHRADLPGRAVRR